jgi:transcription elongation factor Elf1
MRKYAKEKLFGSFFCPICNLEFLYKTSVNSHMKKSKKCNIIRLEKELEEAKKQKPVLKIGDLDKGIKLD